MTRRAPVVLLSVVGLLVSLNLAFYQYGLTASVWDPLFGPGSSHAVLDSAFSRSLPVHDAALGVAVYALEALLESAGGVDRWIRRPWLVLLVGLVAAGMGLTALGLISLQIFVIHHFCVLCLVSAAVSLSVPVLVSHEVLAVAKRIRSLRSLRRPA